MEPLKFKLDPLQYPALQKKMLIRSVALVAFLLAVISVYTMKDANHEDLIFWIGNLIFILFLYAWMVWRGIKKRKAIYDSYSINIDEQGITRVQYKWTDLLIPLSEITAIKKKTDGKFVIKGISNDPLKKIHIPAQIENYHKLEEVLAAIKPITTDVKTAWWERYTFLLSLLIALPVMGVYFVDNKIAVGVCAAISLTTFVYCFFNIMKYRGFANVKRSLWVIGLVIISVLIVTYTKLVA